MSKYVALLRGINVGGNNIIKMSSLREAFEDSGFTNVTTYIQSGNVLFESPEKSPLKLEAQLEAVLSKRFNYKARVLIRSKRQLEQTVAHFPKVFSEADWKHNVIFLSPKIDHKNIVQAFPIKTELERLEYQPGVLFWSARLEGLTRSAMLKLAGRPEYQEMTVRNTNTTRKLLALLQAR